MISASIPNETRKAVYRRDGFACALCGDTRRLQIHHVIPRSEGGSDDPMNLICLCMWCHADAHGHSLRDPKPDWITPEWIEQACVEYVSDLYAGDWYPFK